MLSAGERRLEFSVLSPRVQEGHGSCRECLEKGNRAGEAAGAEGGAA